LIAVGAYVACHIAQEGQEIVFEIGGHHSPLRGGEPPRDDDSGGSPFADDHSGGTIIGDRMQDDDKSAYILQV
jgi:hypothetical protein